MPEFPCDCVVVSRRSKELKNDRLMIRRRKYTSGVLNMAEPAIFRQYYRAKRQAKVYKLFFNSSLHKAQVKGSEEQDRTESQDL